MVEGGKEEEGVQRWWKKGGREEEFRGGRVQVWSARR